MQLIAYDLAGCSSGELVECLCYFSSRWWSGPIGLGISLCRPTQVSAAAKKLFQEHVHDLGRKLWSPGTDCWWSALKDLKLADLDPCSRGGIELNGLATSTLLPGHTSKPAND